MTSVLIVDDNQEFCDSSAALLRDEGFEVLITVSTGLQALAEVERVRPQLVLLDIQLPDVDGFEVARRVSQLDDPPVVVLISSQHSSSYGALLDDAQVLGFLEKAALDGASLAAYL